MTYRFSGVAFFPPELCRSGTLRWIGFNALHRGVLNLGGTPFEIMYSLTDIAEILGRDRVTLLGWVKRFELPVFSKPGYPDCYMPFLRNVVYLRLA